MPRGGGARIRRIGIAIAALAVEAAELPLFGIAFGKEILGLLAVRLLLTTVLVALFLRRNTVARMILGFLRLMAFAVAIIMASGIAGWVAWVLGALALVDAATGFALLLLRSGHE